MRRIGHRGTEDSKKEVTKQRSKEVKKKKRKSSGGGSGKAHAATEVRVSGVGMKRIEHVLRVQPFQPTIVPDAVTVLKGLLQPVEGAVVLTELGVNFRNNPGQEDFVGGMVFLQKGGPFSESATIAGRGKGAVHSGRSVGETNEFETEFKL